MPKLMQLTPIFCNQGYSLLEVLIALSILSFGLLSYAEAQLLALRNSHAAYLRSVAQIRLTTLAEELQACDIAQCSPAAINSLIQAWNKVNSDVLPNSQGYLVAQSAFQSIIINWQGVNLNVNLTQAKLAVPL